MLWKMGCKCVVGKFRWKIDNVLFTFIISFNGCITGYKFSTDVYNFNSHLNKHNKGDNRERKENVQFNYTKVILITCVTFTPLFSTFITYSEQFYSRQLLILSPEIPLRIIFPILDMDTCITYQENFQR